MSHYRLDPEVRALLAAMEAAGGPRLENLPVEEARQQAIDGSRITGAAAEHVASIENTGILGAHGAIPIRIYVPSHSAPRAGLVYFHGGGWVLCNLDTHDSVCRAIANRAAATVISVDYRLAPEHPFPAAVEDCFTATQWVAANARQLGIDSLRLSVGGDSAGGTLSTVVAMKSRDEGGPRLAAQILVYPVTDLSTFETPSYEEFAEGFYLSRSLMQWFRNHYLGHGNASHPHASPLLAPDLRGLPPALIITAECDPLRDEGDAYAQRLRDAGVRVIHKCYPGMIHPFFTLGGVIPQAFDAIAQFADTVRDANINEHS